MLLENNFANRNNENMSKSNYETYSLKTKTCKEVMAMQ